MYDLIILGAGPAGLSAAIYAQRLKLKTLVFAGEVGGQVIEAHQIDNYLGIPGLLGVHLVEKFEAHARALGVEIKDGVKETVILPQPVLANPMSFIVKTNKGEFESQTLIVATGKSYRHLNVHGADRFEGRGITYCATCDAPLFRDKIVAVVGAGDAGQDAAWQLTQYAKRIYLINKYPELRGDDRELQEKIKKSEKIEIINNSRITEVKGDKFVESLVYQNLLDGQFQEIKVQGIFVEIGSMPNSDLVKDLVKLNEKGEIIVDHKTCATSLPGIFAAGDVTDVPEKQIIIAAGEGAKAALSVYQYLKTI